MKDLPERGRLTDQVIAYLKAHQELKDWGLVVGDGDPPSNAGWSGSQPGVGRFQASTTVRTSQAVPLHRENVRSRHSSWRCRYGIRTIGALRSHADHAADLTRAALTDFRDLPMDGPAGWKVQDAVFESLGGVEKRGSGDGATWEVDDVVDLWVVRAAT